MLLCKEALVTGSIETRNDRPLAVKNRLDETIRDLV